jgi:hypothetical protein
VNVTRVAWCLQAFAQDRAHGWARGLGWTERRSDRKNHRRRYHDGAPLETRPAGRAVHRKPAASDGQPCSGHSRNLANPQPCRPAEVRHCPAHGSETATDFACVSSSTTSARTFVPSCEHCFEIVNCVSCPTYLQGLVSGLNAFVFQQVRRTCCSNYRVARRNGVLGACPTYDWDAQRQCALRFLPSVWWCCRSVRSAGAGHRIASG